MTSFAIQSVAIQLFCSCSGDDEASLRAFEKALASLKRSGLVEIYSSQRLLAGTDMSVAINEALDRADIIVLLVSNSFFDSDSCWKEELPRAMNRHEHRAARLIPILVESCLWNDTPFAALKPLPADAKPIWA